MHCLTTYFNADRVVPARSFNFENVVVKDLGNISLPLIYDGRVTTRLVDTKKYVSLTEVTFDGERVLIEREHLTSAGHAASEDQLLFNEYIGGARASLGVGAVNLFTGHICGPREFDRVTGDGGLRVGDRYLLKDLSGRLVAISAEAFEELWRYDGGRYAVRTIAASATRKLAVTIGNDQQVACVDISDGTVKWHTTSADWAISPDEARIRPALSPYNSHPHIYKDVVVLMGPNSYVIGLSMSDGRLLWKHQLSPTFDYVSYYPVVAENGKVYGYASGQLTILDAVNGAFEASYQICNVRDDARVSPVHAAFCDVTNTHFVGVTTKGLVYAIDLQTGAVDWQLAIDGEFTQGHPFVLCNNRIYLQTMFGVICLEGGGGYHPD